MTTSITKIAARTLLTVGVFAVVVALYGLTGTSVFGNTFAQVNVNLTVDSQASYNGQPVPSGTWTLKNLVPGVDKFFNFNDIKPGDSGENTISLHVDQNAWICLQFTNLTQNENGVNKPEGLADVTSGADLANGTEFFGWRDDGDNIFEPQAGETPLFGTSTQSASVVLNNKLYPFADATHPPVLTANQTRYLGIAWCAGNLVVNLVTGAMSCDGEVLGNAAQTDSFSVDVSVNAQNATDNPTFTCNGDPPPPPPPPSQGGLGEEIGLFVKCQIIANVGWPLPQFSTECPNGFGKNGTTTSTQTSARTDRQRR
ncbi:hypothetical protein KW798_00260 [Candidatus Parcubacteria bacterium]|nr:hypothetical protein [Candidatus Parcubacteria bacterium]